MDYATWIALIKAAGGVPTTWPYRDTGTYGAPAARFTSDLYAQAQLGGVLSGHETSEPTSNGDYIYVLFADVTGQPHVMTSFESAENAVFTAGDDAADALGLPSLTGLESALTTALWVGGVVVVGALVIYASKVRPR